ncbi:MAG: hypothetical protein IJ840_06370 [Bacteroidales bacterium]|nr:hypothetical protein [Bacteroidales bacterium]
MRNIDEKTIAALLERIGILKNELSVLEDQVNALLVGAEDPVEPVGAAPAEPVAEEPVTVEQVVAEPVPAGSAVIQSEPVILSEAKDLPADDPDEPIDIAPEDDTPIDISISETEDMPEVIGQYGLGPDTAPARSTITEVGKAILDTAKADTAVMDVMAEKQAWRTDRPGMPVKNIISAISLNDRVFLINTLFGEDPVLFQETISRFNAMGSLSEALAYIAENHQDWDMGSDPVYRLMMAVRRKLS